MTLTLEILAPDHTVLLAQVASIEAADASGRFGLLPDHEPFVTVLEPCVLIYVDDRGVERYAAVDGGVLYLESHRASIATREAFLADQLQDVAEHVSAALEARRRHERSAQSEFVELQATLVKELGKLGERAAR